MHEIDIAFLEELSDIAAGAIREVGGITDNHLGYSTQIAVFELHGDTGSVSFWF